MEGSQEAMAPPRGASNGPPGATDDGLTAVKCSMQRSVSQRMFDSMLDDVRLAICAYRERRINQKQLMAIANDRLDALAHLHDNGTVRAMLDHAENALVEAVLGHTETIDFQRERERLARRARAARPSAEADGPGP